MVFNGKAVSHDKMPEMVAENTLRFVENYRQRTTVRIARSTLVLAAHLKGKLYLATAFIERRGNMKRIVIQRAATKTIVMVQLLTNTAGLTARTGKHAYSLSDFAFLTRGIMT